jgi:hypothetical protein
VLLIIGLVSMSTDGHLGTKLLASYQLMGQAWLGAAVGGAMVRHWRARGWVSGAAAPAARAAGERLQQQDGDGDAHGSVLGCH